MKQLMMSQPTKKVAANQSRLVSLIHCPYCYSLDISPLSKYYKSKFVIYGKCGNCKQEFSAWELDE